MPGDFTPCGNRIGPPSLVSLLWGQILYQNRLFWRNSRAAFSSFILPILLLVVLGALQGNKRLGDTSIIQLVTPGIVVLAVMVVCYQNLATSLVAARDRGLLKRIKGSPLPMGVYLAGRLAFTVGIALCSSISVVAAGVLLFDVQIPVAALPAIFATVILGAACFCALGFAVSSFIPNSDAAPAVLSATFIPLALVSGVFSPAATLPGWISSLVQLLPAEPFAAALQSDFSPQVIAPGFQTGQVMVLLAWLVGATVVAARRFRWDPATEQASSGQVSRPAGKARRDV